jgi:MoxR-like ATPase
LRNSRLVFTVVEVGGVELSEAAPRVAIETGNPTPVLQKNYSSLSVRHAFASHSFRLSGSPPAHPFPMAIQSLTAKVQTSSREELLSAAARLRAEVAKRIVGQESVIEEILMALLAGGHALLVGVPGLAKTLMIRSVSEAMDLEFRRIQFTPDLVPSDITGTEIMEEDTATGSRSFRFVRGPVFANIVLADEINRAPPRTQAALLEAMQEHRVTAAGETMTLPEPFFVLATQNPIEQEGTYPLPEAQLDRFIFDVRIGYPEKDAEVDILRATTGADPEPLEPVIGGDETRALQRLVRDIPAAEPALVFAASLVRATRPAEPTASETVKKYVRWGAGPRAGQALILGAKAHALLAGRFAVAPADILRVARPVLRHRVLPNFAAEAKGITAEQIIDRLLEDVKPPKSDIKL